MQFSPELVAEVTRLVAHARGTCQGGAFELEARTHKPLGERAMDALLGRFVNAPSGTFDETDWEESHDHFFKHKSRRIRGRSWTDSSTLRLHSENVIKTKIGSVQLPDVEWKIVLSSETRVPSDDLPVLITTDFVRIKHRKRFTYTSPRSELRVAFDFTLVWSGKTKTEAEASQRMSDPVYEMEIELLSCHSDLSSEYVATSLLMKIRDHC